MTLHITAKDVGRVAVDQAHKKWTIVAILPNGYFSIVAVLGDSIAMRFTELGDSSNVTKLLRFADAPEAKPPEMLTLKFMQSGHWFIDGAFDAIPDLAGKTFVYRIEGEK